MDAIAHGLADLTSVELVSDGIRVTTHCMYPSNGLIRVTVRGGKESVVVSDDGGAAGEALAAGIPVGEHTRPLSQLVKGQGLIISDGVILSPRMPAEGVVLGILHVANASQEVARWLFEHTKIRHTRDFRLLLSDFLVKRFDGSVVQETIIGHSRKPHKFANVIRLSGGRRLIVDPVAHEASSINARVVANLDVRSTNDPLIEQRIVYDDEEEWKPADLNLLQVGATVVPFSQSSSVIERLVNRHQG
jgi:hypothetical protein